MNGGTLVAIFTLILGVAMVAVIVSQKANTAAILTALGTGTASAINAATAPVTSGGSSTGISVG
jgi:hypothetical protein